MKKLLSLFVLFCISIQSFADESLPAAKITQISTSWVGGAVFYSLEGDNSVEGCSESDKRVVVSKTNDMYDEILSLSLAAYAAGKNVVYRISGCTGGNIMNAIAVSITD